jgi:flagellar basal body-associated protein FliL
VTLERTMAGKEKEPKAEEKPSEAPAKKKLPMNLIVTAVAVLALEGGTVGLMLKMSGGPKRVEAEPVATAPAPEVIKDVEVPIVDAKLPNNLSGHLFLYDIAVVAKVSEKNKDKVTDLLTDRAAELKDRIRTIVASSDPKYLNEPGLETLRRQINYQLDQDLGPDLIKDLLIPKCTPYRAEF